MRESFLPSEDISRDVDDLAVGRLSGVAARRRGKYDFVLEIQCHFNYLLKLRRIKLINKSNGEEIEKGRQSEKDASLSPSSQAKRDTDLAQKTKSSLS